MPFVVWVSLPSQWTLTEVQAGLQVIIALLCTWGIFAFSRFCWQLSSNLVKRNHAVALASLMSINTIGEAYDVIALLKRRIFLQRYWKLLAQSIVVVALTTATIVSGPIAKASTRQGVVVKQISMPGFLATRDFNSRMNANVDWNQTYNALERADYPYDQLLDYIPYTNETWLYRANEWNNSWTMNCKKTEITPITIVDSGICGNFSVEFPATNQFFGYDDYGYWSTSTNALFYNSSWLQDGLIIFTGWNYDFDSSTNKTYNMTVIIAALHIATLPKYNGTNTKCSFGKGTAQAAAYSKVECAMQRPRQIPDEKQIAFPDHLDRILISQSFNANYYDRMATEANTDQTITMLTPDNLIRFYQTYIITKDYQYRRQVNRWITANVRVVQLSSTFIAFGSLYALLVVIGLVNFAIFYYINRDVVRDTPESKLDWIVQSILDESEVGPSFGRAASGRRSVVASSQHALGRASEKMRAAFENAKYGSSTSVEAVPLTNNAAPPGNNIFSPSYGIAPLESPASAPSPHLGHGYTTNPPSPYTGYMSQTGMNAPTAYTGMSSPTAYTAYGGDYNMNPFEASHAAQHSDYNTHGNSGLQSPQGIFSFDQRRGYQRLG